MTTVETAKKLVKDDWLQSFPIPPSSVPTTSSLSSVPPVLPAAKVTSSGTVPRRSAEATSHRIRPMYVDKISLQPPPVPLRRRDYVPWQSVQGGSVAAVAHRRAAAFPESISLSPLSGCASMTSSSPPSFVLSGAAYSRAKGLLPVSTTTVCAEPVMTTIPDLTNSLARTLSTVTNAVSNLSRNYESVE